MNRILLGLTIGLLMLALSACSPSMVDAGGHATTISTKRTFTDLGDYRVEVGRVLAARAFSIPETRRIRFSWSPQAYERIYDARGWRRPTEADWQRHLAKRLKSMHPRVRDPVAARQSITAQVARRRDEEAALDEYKARVRPDGFILRDLCLGKIGTRYFCAKGVTVGRAEQRRLAEKALSVSDPNCRIQQIDPPAVAALSPNYVSGQRRLVVALACD